MTDYIEQARECESKADVDSLIHKAVGDKEMSFLQQVNLGMALFQMMAERV